MYDLVLLHWSILVQVNVLSACRHVEILSSMGQIAFYQHFRGVVFMDTPHSGARTRQTFKTENSQTEDFVNQLVPEFETTTVHGTSLSSHTIPACFMLREHKNNWRGSVPLIEDALIVCDCYATIEYVCVSLVRKVAR